MPQCSPTFSFIRSLGKYVLNAYYVPGTDTVLGTRDTKPFLVTELTFLCRKSCYENFLTQCSLSNSEDFSEIRKSAVWVSMHPTSKALESTLCHNITE